jgi:hypothetical protein
MQIDNVEELAAVRWCWIPPRAPAQAVAVVAPPEPLPIATQDVQIRSTCLGPPESLRRRARIWGTRAWVLAGQGSGMEVLAGAGVRALRAEELPGSGSRTEVLAAAGGSTAEAEVLGDRDRYRDRGRGQRMEEDTDSN